MIMGWQSLDLLDKSLETLVDLTKWARIGPGERASSLYFPSLMQSLIVWSSIALSTLEWAVVTDFRSCSTPTRLSVPFLDSCTPCVYVCVLNTVHCRNS